MKTASELVAHCHGVDRELAMAWLIDLGCAAFLAHESQQFGDWAGHDKWWAMMAACNEAQALLVAR